MRSGKPAHASRVRLGLRPRTNGQGRRPRL